MKANAMPIERLRAAVSYDPETGTLLWKTRPQSDFANDGMWRRFNRRFAGKPAGSLSRDGYCRLNLGGAQFSAHRVAWALMTGEQPAGEIDHINGIKTDNRWTNLRDVDRTTNRENTRKATANNSVGQLGATRHACGKFQAGITVRGKKLHLGLYDTAEAAHAAYIAAKRKLHEGCTL